MMIPTSIRIFCVAHHPPSYRTGGTEVYSQEMIDEAKSVATDVSDDSPKTSLNSCREATITI